MNHRHRRNASVLLGLAAMSLGLLASGSASAEVPGTLKTVPVRAKNSSGTVWSTVRSVICSAVGNIHIKGHVIGAPFDVQITGLGCNEASLENTTVEGVAMVEGIEKLKFTGATVVEPAGCAISESTITTNALKLKIDHHYKNEVTTKNPWSTRRPVSGETIATIKVTGCAAEGSYPLKGMFAGTLKKETGVVSTNHQEAFNAETNEGSSLTLAGEPATITGEINRELTSGESFQTSE
jgi:hypothetical protein